MDKPKKRVDNFGTFLKTVSRSKGGAEVKSEVAPMRIIDTLSHHEDAVGIVELAGESGLPISQTVIALKYLQGAELVDLIDGNNEAVRLTPTGRTLANISISDWNTKID